MALLPSSEMLLTNPILNMDYHFKFAVLTLFGLSTRAGHITHSTLTGICCDITRFKMLSANQDLPALAALP